MRISDWSSDVCSSDLIGSDVICPWCFIGKRRLEKALAQRPDIPFEIGWRPFQLNPDMPRDGADRKTYLETKFGGPERAQQIYARISAEGAKEGIPFDFNGIRRTRSEEHTSELQSLMRISYAV